MTLRASSQLASPSRPMVTLPSTSLTCSSAAAGSTKVSISRSNGLLLPEAPGTVKRYMSQREISGYASRGNIGEGDGVGVVVKVTDGRIEQPIRVGQAAGYAQHRVVVMQQDGRRPEARRRHSGGVDRGRDLPAKSHGVGADSHRGPAGNGCGRRGWRWRWRRTTANHRHLLQRDLADYRLGRRANTTTIEPSAYAATGTSTVSRCGVLLSTIPLSTGTPSTSTSCTRFAPSPL